MAKEEVYLGSPIMDGANQKVLKEMMIGKISGKLANWRGRLLSQAGRGVLVQVVLTALPCHLMATNLLSKTLCSKVDAIIRDFWWGVTDEKKTCYVKAWKNLCTPKFKGGLGFRMARLVNLAFLMKMAWQLYEEKDGWWQNQIEGKYFHSSSFWEYMVKPQDSCFIKAVAEVKSI
jgi:hypothetical protein